MRYVLGLDPSVRKSGYAVFDLTLPDPGVVEKGLLRTSPLDGILVQRLVKQAGQIEGILSKYQIPFVGMEAPFFGANSTEKLFALNQYLHKVFLDRGSLVVAFPPQMLKKLVFPDRSVADIGKPHMIDRAKTALGMHGKKLAEDVADAFWAGHFGKRFYLWHVSKTLTDSDLGDYEREAFNGKHTYTRGKLKGVTEYTGIIYRENEMFFDFCKIKRRQQDATRSLQKEKARSRNRKDGTGS